MDNNQHFLKMTGWVPQNKRKEFEQTFRFVEIQRSPDCLHFKLTVDIFTPNEYHFFSVWPSKESLEAFCVSQEFQVLRGAFQTLGLSETDPGEEHSEMKSFELLII